MHAYRGKLEIKNQIIRSAGGLITLHFLDPLPVWGVLLLSLVGPLLEMKCIAPCIHTLLRDKPCSSIRSQYIS